MLGYLYASENKACETLDMSRYNPCSTDDLWNDNDYSYSSYGDFHADDDYYGNSRSNAVDDYYTTEKIDDVIYL